ncbi:hypothetical protein Ahia01_000201400, partial [Argonauta hians]
EISPGRDVTPPPVRRASFSFRLPNPLTRLWSGRGCRRRHLPKVPRIGFETGNSHQQFQIRCVVDVERSSSLLNNLLSDRRHNLSFHNRRNLLFVMCNSK